MPAGHVSDTTFQEEVIKSDLPVLVDFFAVWCGPCKMAAPILDKMSEELQGKVKIVKLDVDEYPEIAQQFGVMSIPTVVLFNKGEAIDRKVGFGGEAGYKNMISKVLGA